MLITQKFSSVQSQIYLYSLSTVSLYRLISVLMPKNRNILILADLASASVNGRKTGSSLFIIACTSCIGSRKRVFPRTGPLASDTITLKLRPFLFLFLDIYLGLCVGLALYTRALLVFNVMPVDIVFIS